MEGTAVSFSGQDFSLQGGGDRFVLPADFRKLVRQSSSNERTLCLTKHDRWPCLQGFGLGHEHELAAQIDREEAKADKDGKSFDRELRENQLFGGFVRIPFDDSGRFVLPGHLNKLAKIGDALFFQGAGKTFTVWSPRQLETMGDDWATAIAACAEFEAKARAGKAAK